MCNQFELIHYRVVRKLEVLTLPPLAFARAENEYRFRFINPEIN